MFRRTFLKKNKKKESTDRSVLYVSKTLQPEEEIIYVSRFHWIYTLLAIGPLLAAITAVVIAWAFGVPLPFLLVIGLPILFAIAHAMNKLAYKYVNRVIITSKRLIVQKGWTSRNTMDLGLDRILGHKIKQDAWGRALDYGSFNLVGAGVGEFSLPPYMANPTRFRMALTGAKEAPPTPKAKAEERRPRSFLKALARR